jgi:uncharacterized protein
VSTQTDMVSAYMEGFRRSDHAAVLATLTDDVEWVIHGHRSLRGKEAFDAEIENDAFEGSPELTVRGYLEDGATVIVPHIGLGHLRGGAEFRFQAVDLFTFRDGLICRVESYVVPDTAFDGLTASA